MIYFQNKSSYGSNIIVRGKAHHFDVLGFYKGEVELKFINLQPARIRSFMVQGNVVESVNIADDGSVVNRELMPVYTLIPLLSKEKKRDECLGVFIRNIVTGTVATTQYILVYRK